MHNAEKEIKKVIERAYIQGIHGTQDEETVRSGFHPDFTMYVLRDDAVDTVSVAQWLLRLEKIKADNPDLWNAPTTHNFLLVDVSDHAAVAKLDVFKGETHFSTDYMLLYKFQDGWKIVSKVFS